MDYEISGLPLHILIVHATVVLVPLAALGVFLSALSVKIRRKLGAITPILAGIALILVPITQVAGEWLMKRVDTTPLIATHMSFGKMVLPWTLGLFLVALGQWLLHRKAEKKAHAGTDSTELNAPLGEPEVGTTKKIRFLSLLGMTLAFIVSAGSMFSIYQAGESGSRAVWENAYQKDK